MTQALWKLAQDITNPANDALFGRWGATIHYFELEKSLKKFDITIWEYKKRVAVQLKWYKNGITSESDLDKLLSLASREILDELESLWNMQNGVFDWWKLQSGESIAKIKAFVLENLGEK